MTEHFAPAKINLGLSVVGRRPDGYHELHTLMVPLTVGDMLEIVPAPDLSLQVTGADLPTDGRNLVYRAARAYLDAAGVGEGAGAAITLHKRLPLASGLGGGSSDAATTLLALTRLYPSGVDLPALALGLGADVPFFLPGGAALASGVGEVLRPVDLPPVHLVLLNPGVEVSAADAYGWLAGRFTPPLDLGALLAALASGQEVPYFNALQPEVVRRHPDIARALAALHEVGLHSPLMSGSGSTCFALAGSAAQAQAAARRLGTRWPEWWVAACRTR